jgi:hypothetical protein
MKRALSLCFLGLSLLAVESCVSTPITTPEVIARLAPERDLARYGVPFGSDPFLYPATLLMPQDEFATIVIDIALPESSRVIIDGEVDGADGKSIARLYSREELRSYWLARGKASDADMMKRLDTLDRFYPPQLTFNAPRGRTEYYVAMIGRRPLPRPAKAVLYVTLGSGASQTFTFDLPPFKK